MVDLAEFLLARIAEDEAVASPFRNDFGDVKRWRCDEIGGKVREIGPTEFGLPNVISESDTHLAGAHIARHSPARVLAECEAKRRIVALHNPCDDWSYGDASTCPELVALALPYADHPDYREEWKP